MANEITLQQARSIVQATEALKNAREQVRLLGMSARVTIVVEWATGRSYEGQKGHIRHEGTCQGSQIARSTVAAVRQHWERAEAEAIRTLRQLGAEVPNG